MSNHTSEKSNRGLWIMAVLMVLLIGAKFYPLSIAPNSWFIGDSQDGFRSLLTTEYHIKYDSTYNHFEGMNYPYGDAIYFTGSQPLTTNFLKWFSTHVFDLSPYTTGIIFYLLFISYFFSGILLYLLLRKLKLPEWYAIIVAIGVTLLAPQNERFSAHYDLSYLFVLPFVLYMTYLFEENRKWSKSLLMGGSLLILSQIQSYLFALAVFFLAAYFFLRMLTNLGSGLWKSYLGHALLQLALPMGVFLLWMSANDPNPDRCATPYGFLTYIAFWHTVFFSPEFWSGEWTKQFIPAGTWVTGEGWAYIGLAATAFLLKETLWRVYRLFVPAKPASQNQPSPPSKQAKDRRFLAYIFGASVLLLILSMGIPFIFQPFEFLVDYVGPIRQFRSLGRFAWAFYYAANIVTFYLLYHQVKYIQKAPLKWGLLAAFTGMLLLEAGFFTKRRMVELYPRPELREGLRLADNAWLDRIDVDRYQAILPLPYYHIGSENIWMEPFGKSLQHTFWPSVYTGLPNMGVFLARSSLSQTINQLAFVGEPYRYPKLLDDLPSDKPLLVVIDKIAFEGQWYRFDHLLYGLKSMYENQWVKIYELPPTLIAERVAQRSIRWQAAFDTATTYPLAGLLSIDSLANFAYQSYDQNPSTKIYRGKGAWQGPGENKNVLFEGFVPDLQAKQRYVYSAWHYIREDLHLKSLIEIREFDPTTNEEVQYRQLRMANYIRSIDGDWALVDIPFRPKQSNSKLKFIIENNDLKENLIFVDEFQIRPQEAVLFKRTAEEFARNNRWFPYQDRAKAN